MSPKAEGGFVYKSSLGLRGHLINNFPNVMVLKVMLHRTIFYDNF